MAIPKKERIKKEVFRLVRPAIKPIMGGPIKRPIIPIEETAAIATGGGKILDLPAALKTRGTPGETPIPTNNNPTVDGTRNGKKTANSKPVVVKIPHDIMIFLKPIRCVSQSVINLMAVIEIIKAV